jgi:hypothetical protein
MRLQPRSIRFSDEHDNSCELHKGSEVLYLAVPSRHQTAEVAELGKEPLHLPQTLVPSQHSAILHLVLLPVSPMRRDYLHADEETLVQTQQAVIGQLPCQAQQSLLEIHANDVLARSAAAFVLVRRENGNQPVPGV